MQFLVDLARPSHLGTNPFLRGFYFTGVRPVVVDDVAAAPCSRWRCPKQDLTRERRKFFVVWVRRPMLRRWPEAGIAQDAAMGLPEQPVQRCSGKRPGRAGGQRIEFAGERLRRVALATIVLLGLICLFGFGFVLP